MMSCKRPHTVKATLTSEEYETLSALAEKAGMTKAEFIAKATEYGYMDEDIEEMIELVEDANQDGVPMSYDYLAENVLAEQPAY